VATLYPFDSGESGTALRVSSVNSTILEIASRASKAALNLALIASRASRTERFASLAGDIFWRGKGGLRAVGLVIVRYRRVELGQLGLRAV